MTIQPPWEADLAELCRRLDSQVAVQLPDVPIPDFGSWFDNIGQQAVEDRPYSPPGRIWDPAPDPGVLDFTNTYMRTVHEPEVLLEMAVKALDGVEYDTLVGTGLSGTIAVTNLARSLNKRYLIVRKRNDGSHSSLPVEGQLGKRWIFVDDLVQTGTTLARVFDTVEGVRYERGFESEFVGSFLYHDFNWEGFYRATQARHHHWLSKWSKQYRGQFELPRS